MTVEDFYMRQNEMLQELIEFVTPYKEFPNSLISLDAQIAIELYEKAKKYNGEMWETIKRLKSESAK